MIIIERNFTCRCWLVGPGSLTVCIIHMSCHGMDYISVKNQLLRIFGPELIRINSLIKFARSVVTKNCTEHGFFLGGVSREISSASERAFLGVLGDIFDCSTPSKKSCFSTQEFTRFLSTVSSQRRDTCSDVSVQTK